MSKYRISLNQKKFGDARYIVLLNLFNHIIYYEIKRKNKKLKKIIHIKLLKLSKEPEVYSIFKLMPTFNFPAPSIPIPSPSIYKIIIELNGNFVFDYNYGIDEDKDFILSIVPHTN